MWLFLDEKSWSRWGWNCGFLVWQADMVPLSQQDSVYHFQIGSKAAVSHYLYVLYWWYFTYLFRCFDAYNVYAIIHEIDQFWVLQMMTSIVEDILIEAISVTVSIFIGPGPTGKHHTGELSGAACPNVQAQEAGNEEDADHQDDHQTEDDPLET